MGTKTTILIQPDAFASNAQNEVAAFIPRWGEDVEEARLSGPTVEGGIAVGVDATTAVSRPLNGISVKPNAHAFVQVLKSDGVPIAVFNQVGGRRNKVTSSSTQYSGDLRGLPGNATTSDLNSNSDGKSTAWTDWLLQSVQEARVEKTQVVETFGDTFLYAFGERPRTLQFNGVLLNTEDYNWRAVFWENWDKFFRASKLMEADARMYIGWEDVIVEGYPLNAVAREVSDNDNMLSFSFTFFVTNYINISAQSGFSLQRNRHISVTRSGYPGSPLAKRRTEVNDKRKMFVELLGIKGATLAGGAAYTSMLEAIEKLPPELRGKASEDAAKFVGRNVAAVADAASKGALKWGTSSANAQNFLTAFALRFTHDTYKTLTKMAVAKIEREGNFKSGEVNGWFGLLGQILERADNRGWLNTDLDGGKLNPESSMMATLTGGSIDRIVQAMAYNTVPDTMVASQQPSTLDRPEVTRFGKHRIRPGAATIVHHIKGGVSSGGAGVGGTGGFE